MDQAIAKISQSSLRVNVPKVKTGQTVRVHQRIKEGSKERIQVFEGLVIKTHGGKSIDATFTVRKVVGGIGVERVFPLHSANIAKVEIVKISKVRRSKLYYMRNRTGKSARLKSEITNISFEPKSVAEIEAAEKAKAEAEAAKKAAEEAAQAEKEKEAAEKAEDSKETPAEVAVEENAEAKSEETSEAVTEEEKTAEA